MILRIEDTDQKRYVDGAEQYILDSLEWCGIHLDESIIHGGKYGLTDSHKEKKYTVLMLSN